MTDLFRRALTQIDAAARWVWLGGGERTPWLRRIAAILFAFALPVPVLLILLFRFAPIPATPQIVIAFLSGDSVHHSWAGRDISPYLGRAVIAAEDQRFCQHNGFDWTSIDKAIAPQRRARSSCFRCEAGCARASKPG